MGLTATFHLSSPALPFTDVAASQPGLQFQFIHWEGTDQGLALVILKVTGDELDSLDSTFAAASSVEQWSLINDSGSSHIYKVIPADEIGANFDEIDLQNGVPETVTVMPDGWRVRGLFPNREALIGLRTFCEENGIGFRLEELSESQNTERERFGLSYAQIEALHKAHELGYFEVPRRTGVEEVASELGISSPALSERLRRGQMHLVEHYLSLLRDNRELRS